MTMALLTLCQASVLAFFILPLTGCNDARTGGTQAMTHSGDQKTEKATFGMGCFWGPEATFSKVKGVTATAVGYIGGTLKNPTYQDVCSGRTGHCEAVQVEYDPRQVSYEELLAVFWANHDPTTLNRQGPDVGQQYRSAIFYHTPEQKATATASREKQQASGKYKGKIVTEITPATEFYRAEEYHQRYAEKHGLLSCPR
jgi:peptide-methionine (S)-S-oxide reductase